MGNSVHVTAHTYAASRVDWKTKGDGGEAPHNRGGGRSRAPSVPLSRPVPLPPFPLSVPPSLPPSLSLVSSSLLGPVDPSFRALSACHKVTVRHHQFNNDSLSLVPGSGAPRRALGAVRRPRRRLVPRHCGRARLRITHAF